MVLLRLTVKVFPPEPLRQQSTPDTTEVDGGRNSINFLLVVRNPEEVTLGRLAYMIQNKWAILKPDAGPLEIKKLVDDKHAEDALDIGLTVADVFVDSGKALTDGLDQRGAIRVIQQPGRQGRYGSVVQDWAAVASNYARPLPPLFSDSPRHEPRSTAFRFTDGPVVGPLHQAKVPEADYAPRPSETGEEISSRQDNHYHASPILIEDPQKSRNFISFADKIRDEDLLNEEGTALEVGKSILANQEEEIAYGTTLKDALVYMTGKDEAIARELDRQGPPKTSSPGPQDSTPQSSLPNHMNSKVAMPNKRQVEEAGDIFTIPPIDQEDFQNPARPQPAKRQRRNISRADEFTIQDNKKILLASTGDRPNNAIIVDSDIGDNTTGQIEKDYDAVISSQSSVRRGTRKSSIRGPGRKSMALKLAITAPRNDKDSAEGSASITKIPPNKKSTVLIPDSDIEIVDPPKASTQTTDVCQVVITPPSKNSLVGGSHRGVNRNATSGSNGIKSTKKDSSPKVDASPLAHVNARDSNPIYTDISDSDPSDDTGSPASGVRQNTKVSTPQKAAKMPSSPRVKTLQTPGSSSTRKLRTRNDPNVRELTEDPDKQSEGPSHRTPSRPPDSQEIGLGITSSPVKRARSRSMSQLVPVAVADTNSNSKRGVSTTPAFPRPRPASQAQTEAEKVSSGDPHTPRLSVLRSSQKFLPGNSSARRSVSFADGPNVDIQSTPASASSVKIGNGNTVDSARVTPESLEYIRTDRKLQRKIEEARFQGKSEDYCELLREIKSLTEKLYYAKPREPEYKIAKYEYKLNMAMKNLRNHPEEDQPDESTLGEGRHESHHREEVEDGTSRKNYNERPGSRNGSQSKSQHQIGFDGAFPEDPPDQQPRAQEPSATSTSRDLLAYPSSPSTGDFVEAANSLSSKGDGASGKAVEEEETPKDGNGLKRKIQEQESVTSPKNSKRHRPDHDSSHLIERGLGTNKMNTSTPEQEGPNEPEQRNGQSPFKDQGAGSMTSSDSSSSDSDSDSESDSNQTPDKSMLSKHPSLPPSGTSARARLITPFRNIKKNWPVTDAQWHSDDGASAGENTHTAANATTPTVAVGGLGAPSLSQPNPSILRTSNANGRPHHHHGQRSTLKSLLRHRNEGEDESSTKSDSENDNVRGAKGFTALNFLRKTGLM
ncbi:hypothetical protein I7I48_10518 [Histoplasma ohiense]|nr:hypothetical protein I7I48_10518 [Histoplasma ohiense (nom. inval.)]